MEGFAARLQQLYYFCLMGIQVNDNYYQKLNEITDVGIEIETSQSLSNVFQLYDNGFCEALDVNQMVKLLENFSARFGGRKVNSWVFDFYTVEFLLSSGQNEKAIKKLELFADNGNENAIMMLDEMKSLSE